MYDCLGNRRLCRTGKGWKRRYDDPPQRDVVRCIGRKFAVVAFVPPSYVRSCLVGVTAE
jgi:hypothetical protein